MLPRPRPHALRRPTPADGPTIDRTRRRLQRIHAPATPADEPADEATLPTDSDRVVDANVVEPAGTVVLTLGRQELDRLGMALVARSGPGAVRPDTPARLEEALERVIAASGHLGGQPRVLRRPAGLTTPEAWQRSPRSAVS
jgi:hypothetical protein